MPTKVAVVTGSNKGIGYAIVKGLAASNNFNGDIFLTARDEEKGQKALNQLHQEGYSKVKFHQLDIDDVRSVKQLRNFLQDHYGGLDILINNAGIAFKMDSTEPYGHQARVTIKTNYFGTKQTCDILFPLLRNGSRVVNMSSSLGTLNAINGDEPAASELRARFSASDSTLSYEQLDALMNDFVASAEEGNFKIKGWPNYAYLASKVGVSALTRIQHREIMKLPNLKDVVINHVHPGYVKTDMTGQRGYLTPEEGAKSALFASTLPEGTDINGQYIWLDTTLGDWINGPLPAFSANVKLN